METAEEIIEALEADHLMADHHRSAELRRAADMLKEAGDERGAQELMWEKMAFDFIAVPWDDQRRRPRFQPIQPLEAVGPDVCEHWRGRAKRTRNPAVQARLYDLLWEKQRQYADALQAFEAYLQLGDALLVAGQVEVDVESVQGPNREAHLRKVLNDPERAGRGRAKWEGVQALSRALHLATLLNDRERVRSSAQKCIEWAERLLGRGSAVAAHDLVEAVLLSQSTREIVDLQRVAELCDRGAASCDVPARGPLQRGWLDTLREVALARKDEVAARAAQVRIAESFEAEAEFWKQASPLPRQGLLMDAIQAYQKAGHCEDKVRELLAQHAAAVEASAAEMKEIRGTVQMPSEVMEQWEEKIRENARRCGVASLAAEYWLPREPAVLRQQAEETAKGSVFLQFIPRVSQEARHVVAYSAGADDQLDLEVINGASLHLQLKCVGLMWALETMREEQGVGAEEVVSFLRQSNVFEDGLFQLMKHGLERFFAEDYVSAIHILVFQIEGVIRDLAASLGLPVTKPGKEPGTTRLRQLAEFLAEEKIREGLGERLRFSLRVLLTEQTGQNMRNVVGHAMRGPDWFVKERAALLVLMLCQLARFRLMSSDAAPGDAESSQ